MFFPYFDIALLSYRFQFLASKCSCIAELHCFLEPLRSDYHTTLVVHHVPDHDYWKFLFLCIYFYIFNLLASKGFRYRLHAKNLLSLCQHNVRDFLIKTMRNIPWAKTDLVDFPWCNSNESLDPFVLFLCVMFLSLYFCHSPSIVFVFRISRLILSTVCNGESKNLLLHHTPQTVSHHPVWNKLSTQLDDALVNQH